MGTGPLEGITVVDVSSAVAGAWVSSHLAEMGADVVLIEKVGTPDVMRLTGAIIGDQSGCWVQMHRNKRGMDLDIRDPRGHEILMQLVERADVFVQNFRPGVAERLRIAWDDLSEINPELVYLSVSGFGPDGPYAHRPVYDPIIQSLTGMAEAQNGDFVKAVVADKTAAMTGANAVLGALLARANGAGGQHIEVNLLDSMLSWMWLEVFWNESVPDAQPTPTYSEWYSPWKTADGWVAANWVNMGQYARACAALGAPHLADDPRFATRAARLQNSDAQREEFAKLLVELTTAEALEALEAADVPCAPVLDRSEIFDDPQVRHNGTIVEHEHPTAGHIRTTRFPARFSKTPTQLERLAPGKGEHTDEVLAELGCSTDAIAALRADGIVA
ncbi:CaiB/BaiF CoA transferase family protein [Candidatus Poriferisodalis sp.]|uniref:CaiB/BaiF CoA transferase family protein n=1 Tax=Candidatus Poriferisodalis sp. TaxID=3101277 RepID=UPI003D0BBB1E